MSEPAEMSVDELEHELATLASHMAAGMCRWLEIVGELERRGRWGWGYGTCAQWLAWRCALLPRTAREHVRVARRLRELPLVHAAFACGELSYAKVRALTRVAAAETEDRLLGLARVMTASQLERALRAYRRVTTREARDVQAREFLTTYSDEDGSVVVRGRLAPEDGALFRRALEAERDLLWEGWSAKRRGSAEPRREPRRPTNTEALTALADRSLASDAFRTGGERYQVVVHVDETAFSHDDGGCELADGAAVAPETARRLACDAAVVRMSEKHGKPADVGRKTRTVSPALRRALTARDHGCRFPGCENRRFVHAHHREHWAKGGQTTLGNLVLLCSRHHRLVHEDGYSIDERMRFYDRYGCLIPSVPRPPPGTSAGLRERNRHLAIGARTCANGTGDRMDLALAVDALVRIGGQTRRSAARGSSAKRRP